MIDGITMDNQIHKVGHVDKSEARVIRIVHISDTHMRHEEYIDNLPVGDVLIHSGDFSAFSLGRYCGNRTRDRDNIIDMINNFFSKVNFKHKIFVPGNHELSFTNSQRSYIEENLTAVHYLQDSSVDIEGLKIYGSPWNRKRWTSYARGFACNDDKMARKWKSIPQDTNILVTHMPPQGILDLAHKKFSGITKLFSQRCCDVCKLSHEHQEHWGCEDLRNTVLNIKPTLHLFGHVHEDTGVHEENGVTFSNAAMKIHQTINVFDYYV